ncbi:MAG: TDP-N-acetylfucosamine:lipid II N-acetylfucosaminyltransferase [Tissierellia bacterium]|nr:TDP-N-acetylfucosamine:lipid II N-acetylfucosaminyltransferase [Tissierellia bacterium]
MQDNKFFADLISEIKCRGLEENNLFAIKYYQKNRNLIYINTFTSEYSNYIIIDKNYNLNEISKDFDKIIFHNLFIEDIKQLSRFQKNGKKVYWRQWTGDSFNLLNISKYISGKTFEHLYIDNVKRIIKNETLFNLFKRLFYFLIKLKYSKLYVQAKEALNKIDYAMNWYKLETDLLNKEYSTFNAEYFKFSYFKPQIKSSIDNSVTTKNKSEGFKILLGHNGHPDTNYIDAINLLYNIKKKSNKKFQVNCILSYGNKTYIEKVVSLGEKLLQESFNPITSFLSTDKYYDFVLSHDVFIFNSRRAVGADNIFKVINTGAKVFFNQNNPMYDFFTEMGVKCFTTSSLIDNYEEVFIPMKLEDRNKNISILNKDIENSLEQYNYAIEQLVY